MTPSEVLIQLQEKNPAALLLEPRDVYDKALVGVTATPKDDWPRETGTLVAVYGVERCLEAIMESHECDDEEAREWFYYNTSGAWLGQGTPTFVWEQETQ